ncbi:cysteine desulfurase family protein [Elusimicrobiota bacterium]
MCPKGAGALYVSSSLRLKPILEGGIQEKGIRPGMENIPAIAGMGKAAGIAARNMTERSRRLIDIRDRLLNELPKRIDRLYITGHLQNRLPGHVSFCVEFVEGESILLFLDMEGIAVSSGSACTSKALKASHVLLACGLDHALAQGSIVASLGIDNTHEDADYFMEKLPAIIEKLRQMSPLYAEYLRNMKGE